MRIGSGEQALAERVRRLEQRLARERSARLQAERLLESRSLALYESNQALIGLAGDLERRVEERTRELSTERQRALEIADTDALTGIANRGAFNRRLDREIAAATSDVAGFSVLLIDLDHFKAVNDQFGHTAGDALLQEVARRIVSATRPVDLVARLGGDEFGVILSSALSSHSAPEAAHRILKEVCRPVLFNERELPCSCSIGLAPGAGIDADVLLGDVDMALYASKRSGRGRVTNFQPSLRSDLDKRAALDAEVRIAVAEDRIEPWYQPIVDPVSGRCLGLEVLARWHLADGSVRPPSVFIGPVEDMRLLDVMMERLLLRAFAEAGGAVREGRLHYVSVNVSPTQFNQGWVQLKLTELLRVSGFPPTALLVEITEHALLQDPAQTRLALAELSALGIRIALDDFGVGYSNFSMMLKLPIHILKLDRSLSCGIVHDPHALALCEGVLDLARRLKVRVVAEGVETEEQAAMLLRAGCDAMQGYWFARPQRDLSDLLCVGLPGPGSPCLNDSEPIPQ